MATEPNKRKVTASSKVTAAWLGVDQIYQPIRRSILCMFLVCFGIAPPGGGGRP